MSNGILAQGSKMLVNVNGNSYTIDTEHCPYADRIFEAFEAGDMDLVERLVDVRQGIEFGLSASGLTKLLFKNDKLLLNGEELSDAVTNRLIAAYKARREMGPIVSMMERLEKNPTYSSRNETYLFLENNNLPMTPDGLILAYKYVSIYEGDDITDKNGNTVRKGDYIDSYTLQEYRNNVGDTPNMPRNRVDDNRGNHCSNGLHIGSLAYIGNTGEAMVVVTVDPKDVVSVPNDHNQKVRVCAYEVVAVARAPGVDFVDVLAKAPVLSLEEIRAHLAAERNPSPAATTDRWEVRTEDGAVASAWTTRALARKAKQAGQYLYDTLRGRRV